MREEDEAEKMHGELRVETGGVPDGAVRRRRRRQEGQAGQERVHRDEGLLLQEEGVHAVRVEREQEGLQETQEELQVEKEEEPV